MSVGAKCFTSSGSNGGSWVVLVFFLGDLLFFFFLKKKLKGFFVCIRDVRPQKSVRDLQVKKFFGQKKNCALRPPKNYATYTQLTPKEKVTYTKKKKTPLTPFPQSSYASSYRHSLPPTPMGRSRVFSRTYVSPIRTHSGRGPDTAGFV